jgi:triosephosphate isomerase
MRKKFIAGNWKLNKTVAEAVAFAKDIKGRVAQVTDVEIAIAPVFTAIAAVASELKGGNVGVSSQDLFWEKSGAFTGEVSGPLLKEAGCQYAIIAHSERRQYFNETNETAARKVKAAFDAGLTPILCVGETLKEREENRTFEVVGNHVRGGLKGLDAKLAPQVVIAYEPVWAIGTGKTATPAQAQEVHAFIRAELGKIFSPAVAEQIRIQYGGSVKPDNVKELMGQKDIDGALVGGASLDPASFEKLVKFNL